MKLITKNLLCMFLVLMLSLVVSPVIAEGTPEQIPGTTKVTAEDLIALVEQHDDLVIIDARTAQDYAGGYIEGAVSLPNTDTNPDSLAKNVPSKNTPVLIYCNGIKCGRSVESCKIAVTDGYSKVYWYRGGWDDWVAKGLPVSN